MSKKWEYAIFQHNADHDDVNTKMLDLTKEEVPEYTMNELGLMGWELVSITDSGDEENELHNFKLLYFKRELCHTTSEL